MPKHRSTVYTVVREELHDLEYNVWSFHAVIGIYLTPERADEVASAYHQELKDTYPTIAESYRFTVHASTWYEE